MSDYKPSAAEVKVLRDQTGAGMLDVRDALAEAAGDLDAAKKILRERGQAKAAKRGGRTTTDGKVASYIHGGGTKGVLVEIGCETDFVANTDKFQEFAKDICLQIVSSDGTLYVSVDEVPEEVKAAEIEVYRSQAADKPPEVQDKIAEGKLRKWYEEVVLLNQPYFRDEDLSVEQVRAALSSEMGENIEIKRFASYTLGQE
ncbi:MAG: elongation factor Ts [Thermoleophilia bacterium]|jgi:elongation factor Ts|nr:elongation factor Ts [Thermoleophilia bacterium]PHX80850.1 MAG: elongation factor Ts [Thermoleophilia bacterium]